MEILKVSSHSSPNSVAGAIAGVIREQKAVEVQAVGAGAANQAIKAIAIARGYLAPIGIDLICIPAFANITIDGDEVRKINLNTATIDQLKRHPYLDYYQAKAILRYREQNGPYKQVSDILNIPLIDSETFTLIEPYLTCNSQQNK